MKRISIIILLLAGAGILTISFQQVSVGWRPAPHTGSSSNLRGLSVVSDSVIWASGSGGTFMRSMDGGGSWYYGTVKGAENLDFRDIHAENHLLAWVISAGIQGLFS